MENRTGSWPWKRLFIFSTSVPVPSLSLSRALFSVYVFLSLVFPLSIYCYTLAESEAGGVTQLPRALAWVEGSKEGHGMLILALTPLSRSTTVLTYYPLWPIRLLKGEDRRPITIFGEIPLAPWQALQKGWVQEMRKGERHRISSNTGSLAALPFTVGPSQQQCGAQCLVSSSLLFDGLHHSI